MRAILVMMILAVLAFVPEAPGAGASEHDRARGAVQSGEVRPLGDILAGLRGRYPGRVLDAELSRRGRGNWRYDLKILQADGRVLDVAVDARTGRVLGVKGRDSGRGGRNKERGRGRNRR